uniref:YEATS domain-containing protein n=1 Tax=Laticauda laticaudata TaxID=8630 RepID=A0A8C5WNM8_LATLA
FSLFWGWVGEAWNELLGDSFFPPYFLPAFPCSPTPNSAPNPGLEIANFSSLHSVTIPAALLLAKVSLKCAVQVKLELGHRAQVRKKPTVEGFTHDWMVFVRGPEHSNIQHFVEKVVFHLHDSFPRPKRGK